MWIPFKRFSDLIKKLGNTHSKVKNIYLKKYLLTLCVSLCKPFSDLIKNLQHTHSKVINKN
jgi:hypothetical protein